MILWFLILMDKIFYVGRPRASRIRKYWGLVRLKLPHPPRTVPSPSDHLTPMGRRATTVPATPFVYRTSRIHSYGFRNHKLELFVFRYFGSDSVRFVSSLIPIAFPVVDFIDNRTGQVIIVAVVVRPLSVCSVHFVPSHVPFGAVFPSTTLVFCVISLRVHPTSVLRTPPLGSDIFRR